MLTRLNWKQKETLEALANDVLRLYEFSLIPTDPKFKSPEKIADRIGGGIIYDDTITGAMVCRCGEGFLIKLPTKDSLVDFAYGLATLFVLFGYAISEKVFYGIPNMRWNDGLGNRFESIIVVQNAILLPVEKLRKCTEEHLNGQHQFSPKEVANALQLPEPFVRRRLINTGMMNALW